MKKILFIAPFPPPIHGASLRNQSIADSKLINNEFNLKTFRASQASDVDDIGSFSWRKIFQTLSDLKSLVICLRRFRPDLVYFNISLFGFALYRDALYATIFKVMGYKLLYHLRTQGVREQVEHNFLKRWLFLYLFRNVEVICLSQVLYQDIALVYRKTPFIVNNGIASLSENNRKESYKPHVCTILFLSNLSILKGINDFLSALEILTEKGYKFKANIVGRGFDYSVEHLREKVSQSIYHKSTRVLGPLYGAEKLEILYQTDIFVLPTHFEAFPGVVLEAMQLGLPVVSTIEGAIPELVDDGNTGILVEKKNPELLSNAIATLIDNPTLRMKMGKQGKTRFEEKYTIEIFEKRMIEVFHQVLNKT